MSQHDYVLDNQAGAAFRADVNAALLAIVGLNSGATAPATIYAHMLWADTTAGVLKKRNSANSAWITLGNLNDATCFAGALTAALIAYAGSTNLAATDVEGALDELDTEKAGIALKNIFQKAQGAQAIALGTLSGTINTNANDGNIFNFTLNGNGTLANPTNLTAGFTYLWNIDQDATGGRTLAYGNLFKFPGGTVPVLSTAANAKDLLSCEYDGAVLRGILNKDFR